MNPTTAVMSRSSTTRDSLRVAPGKSGGQLVGLQVMRFVAAMLVVGMHSTQTAIQHAGTGDRHWGQGSIGVDIFFVISGFVMALTAPTGGVDWAGRRAAALLFMKRRIIRIVPMYWFYTALKIILVLGLPAFALRTKLEPEHVLASFAFIPMLSPWGSVEPVLPVGWTLMFEMLFYVIFAAAIVLGMPRMIFSMVIFFVIRGLFDAFPDSAALGFYSRSIAFEFVLGIAIAHCFRRGWLLPRPLALVALLVGTYLMFDPAWWEDRDRFLTLGLAVGLVIWAVISLESVIRLIPTIRTFALLGDASYSIYLSHTFVVPLVVTLLMRLTRMPWLTVALIACVAAVVVGYLSYIWLESPMTRRFKRWTGDRNPPATIPEEKPGI